MDAVIETGISLNQWVEQFRSIPLNIFFLFFHHAGNKYGYLVLIVPLCLFRPKLGFALVAAIMTSWAINIGLKELIALPRPFIQGPTNPMLTPASYSFPSGHAQAAGLFWGFWWFKSKSLRAAVIPILFFVFIGLSRVYLGVHYFTDVLAGWAIGLSLAYLTFKIVCYKDGKNIDPSTIDSPKKTSSLEAH